MGFVYRSSDVTADWTPSIKSKGGVDLIVFHAWTAERGTISKIDPRKNRVLFRKPLKKAVGGHPNSSGYRYIVENVESGKFNFNVLVLFSINQILRMQKTKTLHTENSAAVCMLKFSILKQFTD